MTHQKSRMTLVGKRIAVAHNKTENFESSLLNETSPPSLPLFSLSLSPPLSLSPSFSLCRIPLRRLCNRRWDVVKYSARVLSGLPVNNITHPEHLSMFMLHADAGKTRISRAMSHVMLARQIFHCNIMYSTLSRVLR